MSAAALPAPETDFRLPPGRLATEPPERRGRGRDDVALLVARPDGVSHSRFRHLPHHLRPGDLLVVNTSATVPSAVDASWRGAPVVVHLSTRRDDDRWVVELRRPDASGPILDAAVGDTVDLPGGAELGLDAPDGSPAPVPDIGGVRLWVARLSLPRSERSQWLRRHARAITYGTTPVHPLEDHQTVFARHPGSAEMPSAGRPFTPGLVTELVSHGVAVAPVVLHAGVSSLEAGEPPRPERFDVPASTAAAVGETRQRGGRVVAVGTTVVRALESATDPRGNPVGARGWTDLVVGPDRPVRLVDGMITGWHEPRASHLLLLEAVAGPELVRRAYTAALAGPYLWHEFGDSCLLLP